MMTGSFIFSDVFLLHPGDLLPSI